mgnify:CR=1 FL=1
MDFRGKLILAPLAGVTDTTFRRLCRESGADIVVTEMVSAKGLLCDPARSGRYLVYDEAERPVGAQLFGSDPGLRNAIRSSVGDQRASERYGRPWLSERFSPVAGSITNNSGL